MTISHRHTAWICLVLALLSGLAPSQGFVVCIEGDGCVSIEFKTTAATCAGCDGHSTSESPGQAAASTSEGMSCPCIDLALPGCTEVRGLPCRSVAIHVSPWLPPPQENPGLHATLANAVSGAPISWFPRGPDSLPLIRSVLLLV